MIGPEGLDGPKGPGGGLGSVGYKVRKIPLSTILHTCIHARHNARAMIFFRLYKSLIDCDNGVTVKGRVPVACMVTVGNSRGERDIARCSG